MPAIRREICVLGRTLGTTRSHHGDAGGRFVSVKLNDVGQQVLGERAQKMLDLEDAALVLNLAAGTAVVELVDDPSIPAIDQVPSVHELEPKWILILMEDAKDRGESPGFEKAKV